MTASGKPLERSNLIDVTCAQIHSILSGHVDGTTVHQLEGYLEPRMDQLKASSAPFGRPSDASKKSITSGSVRLNDGVTVVVEDADKEFIFAISQAFSIDEIHALILFRSFLYNQGLPTDAGSNPNASLVEEFIEAITPFYYAERLAIVRILIPLLRARESVTDPFHTLSLALLPKIIPDGSEFVRLLVEEYLMKTREDMLEKESHDYKAATRSAKQSSKEQLVMLEVLFWLMWGLVPCDGPTVRRIFSAAYETNLGSQQQNETLLLGEEAQQLQQDIAVLWVLICVEVLELETIAEPGILDISDTADRKNLYTADPVVLQHLHELITSNPGSQFACIYLAWTFVVFHFTTVAKTLSHNIPPLYRPFIELILPGLQVYSTEREPAHLTMSKICLESHLGLLQLLLNLLTCSPWFVTSVAWRTGSHVTDPNAVAFRSLLKGVLMALVVLIPIEHISDFDCLVEVWVALFGRSESQSVVAICKQYWRSDWHQGIARRAIFEVARSRFPVQLRPLIRLLRSMTSSGFLDTDPLYTADSSQDYQPEDRDLCLRHVFYFFDRLSSYSQIIPLSECTGGNARYERQQERYGSTTTAGVFYSTLKELSLPGAAVLHPGTSGRVLSSDSADSIIVCWEIEYSGWKLVLDILHSYLTRKQNVVSPSNNAGQIVNLSLREAGLGADGGIDDALVTDIFDLIRSVISHSPVQAEELMQTLEGMVLANKQALDLVQLTAMILEDALTSTNRDCSQLIASAISVLSAILAIPQFSNRVWIYIRSTAALFGSDRANGSVSAALAMERTTGQYTITLGLLQLVHCLCEDATSTVVPDDPQLHKLKTDVLLRAVRFVHTEIWIEHLGWKYAQLGDRFEIGRRVACLYTDVLRRTPRDLDAAPWQALSRFILELLLLNATTSALTPLVSAIASGSHLLEALYSSRRFGDSRKLIFLLESHLHLAELLLAWRRNCISESRLSLLEQMLCARPGNHNVKTNPIDVLLTFVRARNAGTAVPVVAMNIISGLCTSLLPTHSSTLAGRFSDPESAIASLVRIVEHPYEELSLRYSIWKFFALAMDKEPALATLLVDGGFRTSNDRKEKEQGLVGITAMQVARDSLTNWEVLWDANPQLLAFILRFIDTVWMHHSEHPKVMENLSQDSEFWPQVTSLIFAELGPLPDYETGEEHIYADGAKRSPLHDAVAMHSYRTTVKALALHIAGLDIGGALSLKKPTSDKPTSLQIISTKFKSEEDLTDLLSEAAPNSYRPEIYDKLEASLRSHFPGVAIQQLQSHEPLDEREFGDDFAFSPLILRSRTRYRSGADIVEKLLLAVNLNLSLMHSQLALAEAWQFLLQRLVPHLRGDKTVRPILLSVAASLSFDISRENREGDMAANIHKTRLSFLVAICELAWFAPTDTATEVRSFIELVDNARTLVHNRHQSPASSLLAPFTTAFHPPLLQLLYFCSRFARSLCRGQGALQAEQRLKISLMIDDSLALAINALRVVFVSARSRVDPKLDHDMELLVAVFEQCTRPDVNPSSHLWLSQCLEADAVKTSLDLFSHVDLVGLSDMTMLMQRRRPLYVPHLILFHNSLASIPAAAERLASEGLLAAYSTNFISDAISSGKVDVTLSELPTMRSPAHSTYCSMLAVLSSVITSIGRHNHYFDTEVCGLVQHFSDQIIRALSWSTGDVITLPFLEEVEQVVQLFYAIAVNASPNGKTTIDHVLRIFSPRALHFLQQLNYALTHPNHLSSVFEPITPEEQSLLQQEALTGDPLKRPLVVYLVHRLYCLCYAVVSTLIRISRADLVLSRDKDTWLLEETLVIPHSKIVLGEPASLGTLLEMGNSTIDVLRSLIDLPDEQSLIAPSSLLNSKYGPALNVREGVLTASRNIEVILVYAVSQLAMWLVKSEAELGTNDMDTDSVDDPSERRQRGSLALHDRLRRGMTGELAADIQSLIQKSKPIVAKTKARAAPDLTRILLSFLRERILTNVD